MENGAKKGRITKKAFAEMAGVSAPAITQACKNGTLDKCVSKKGIDLSHPEARQFLIDAKSRQLAKQLKEKGEPDGDGEDGGAGNYQFPTEQRAREILAALPRDIRQLGYLNLYELVRIFGSNRAMLDFVRMLKIAEGIIEAQLKNAEREGILVSRDVVKREVFDPINNAHTQLLTDGARSMAREAYNLARSGADVGRIEQAIAKRIARFLKPIRNRMSGVDFDA